MPEKLYTNALIHTTSPYLLQHAHNPVNWNPWNDQVWQNATKKDSLVIVSIGYSTCHWCHVMEKECFEDVGTANLMNDNFTSIKVDREEMPDVDQIYMDACQLMTGRGGWPLNLVCTPDKRPVFAGTYFPRNHWQSILTQLSDLWKSDRGKVTEYADRMQASMQQLNLLEFPPKEKYSMPDLRDIFQNLTKDFDHQYGGLNRNQKFPLPTVFEYLLDEYLCNGNQDALDFLNFTLLQMANGGIHDHLRGGFYRYATDPGWFAPHFEKMLYDNAQLLSLYARAAKITGADVYVDVANNIIEFIENELAAPDGGYYAALDADSEGIEGRFYVFTWDELKANLTQEELELSRKVYNLTEKGNWEHGFNILHKTHSPAELLQYSGLTAAEYIDRINSINRKLKEAQSKRIRPGLDNKIICSWNGLYLKGIATSARHSHNEKHKYIAQNLGRFIRHAFYKSDTLLRINNGNTRIPAVVEDYANVIHGMIALYELDFSSEWLDFALKLADEAIKKFYDHDRQLFQIRSSDAETIIINKIDISDDVIVSPNSSLCIDLQKLGILTLREDLANIGKGLIRTIRSEVISHPAWYSNWARSAQSEAIGFIQVVSNTQTNMQLFHLPSWALTAQPGNPNAQIVDSKSNGISGFYICRETTCFEPVSATSQAEEIIADLLPRM